MSARYLALFWCLKSASTELDSEDDVEAVLVLERRLRGSGRRLDEGPTAMPAGTSFRRGEQTTGADSRRWPRAMGMYGPA